MKRAWLSCACALLAAAGALAACGGDEPADATRARAQQAARPVPAPRPDAARHGPNSPPVIRKVTIEPPQPVSGETVTAQVEAEDPDGDPVSLQYAWRIKGRNAGGNEPRLLLLGASKHDEVEVVVTPNDGKAEGPSVRATARVRNRPPDLTSIQLEPAGPITGGDDIVVRPQARDVDGDTIHFTYHWTVNGEPVEADSVLDTKHLKRGDVVQVSVVASDDEDDSQIIRTPELKITNGKPHITSQPAAPSANGTFDYKVAAQDPDGDHLRFTLEQAPPKMEINPVSGEISWRPDPDLTGDFVVRVRVEDMQGGSDQQEFHLTLSTENATPAPTPAAPAG